MLNRRWVLENSSHNKHGACSMKMLLQQVDLSCNYTISHFFCIFSDMQVKGATKAALDETYLFSGF